MKSKGISDAFVVAYNNGQKVTMEEAQKLATEMGAAAFSTSEDMNVLPTADNVTVVQPANTTQANNNTTTPAVNNGIIYKVQIGAFSQEIPVEMANKFLSVATKGVATYKDDSGMTIYTVGSLTDYIAADALKNEMVAAGLEDAFIVAYNDKQKISIEEAKRLNGK